MHMAQEANGNTIPTGDVRTGQTGSLTCTARSKRRMLLSHATVWAWLLWSLPGACAQENVLDSLLQALKGQPDATAGRVNTLIAMGEYHTETSNYSKAAECLIEAARIAGGMGDLDTESAALNNLGDVFTDMGEHTQAMEQYRRSLELARKTGTVERIVYGYSGIINEYLETGMPDSALFFTLEAYQLDGLAAADSAELLGHMGRAWQHKRDHAKAIEAYRKALVIDRRDPEPGYLHVIHLFYLGTSIRDATEQGLQQAGIPVSERYPRSIEAQHGALDISRAIGAPRAGYEILLELSETYQLMGDIPQALAHHQYYAELKDSVLTADKAMAVNSLNIQYGTEKKEQQITLLNKDKQIQEGEIEKQKWMRNMYAAGGVLALVLLGALLNRYRYKQRTHRILQEQNNIIRKERDRSDELLLNILPEEVAEELKAKGEAEAKLISDVTVLFTDFKGFTAMSEKVTPKELVHDLHECFSAFDHIMARHGIEKIKTIGDAYMAAGGLPTPNTTHALDVVKAALEIRDFIAEGKARKVAAGLPYFEIRIGIHTGPVVAGIVGVKKFAYDIWGDTVNTASRMESSGEVGQVNISESDVCAGEERTRSHLHPARKSAGEGQGRDGDVLRQPEPWPRLTSLRGTHDPF